ncbi:MAG: MFS transporter [Acidimicrobiales bacterium]|nr:MFS transporter [Acidimicrobiales bacterium]MCB1017260.1 MFS transporter [Acidimicrobiales bacterium]
MATGTVEPTGDLLVLGSARGRIALAASVAASASSMLDGTVVNVALPALGDELGADVVGLQWVITGYLLTLASFILLGGALGDHLGRRRVFVVGAVWFGLASLLCGVAPTLPVLLVARILQGVGAALLTPTSLALLQAGFRSGDRAAAVGAWSGLGGLAGAVGPFVGGWLVDGPGWRWAFLVNLPLLAVAVVASRVFPESRDPDADPRFDVMGSALAVLALAPLTWALTQGPERGWTDPLVLAAAVVAVLAAAGFVVRQRRAPAPLVPRVVFARREFTVLNVVTFLLYGALGVEFFLVVVQLQVSAGWTALSAGTALLPATVLMLVGSARSGRLAARIGPRPQLVAGPLLVAAGLVLLARIDADARWLTDVAPGAVLFGLGLVTFVAPLTASVMGSVDEALVSTASGVNNAVARTGGLLAVAVVPGVAGLAVTAGPAEVTAAYVTAMHLTAGLAVAAAVVSAVGLRRTRVAASSREQVCPVDGAPLQPDPRRCPAAAAAD